jgi:hypothetical protein
MPRCCEGSLCRHSELGLHSSHGAIKNFPDCGQKIHDPCAMCHPWRRRRTEQDDRLSRMFRCTQIVAGSDSLLISRRLPTSNLWRNPSCQSRRQAPSLLSVLFNHRKIQLQPRNATRAYLAATCCTVWSEERISAICEGCSWKSGSV